MNWITREHPKIDRIACPWLIKKCIDKKARFYFVPFSEVKEQARLLNAIPFDVPGTEFTHYDEQCTFDYFIHKYKITDKALHRIARIVRGADTDKHELAPESAGIWAIFSGLSYNIKDDLELLRLGFILYDALYSWARYLPHKRHTLGESEKLLYDLFEKFIRNKPLAVPKPYWANELDEFIRASVQADIRLSLKSVAETLNVHPSYLSREFSKYFNDLTFTAYIRRVRVKKAITLLETTDKSLAEIALASGYSDQSHFTRSFKKETGLPPGSYKKRFLAL